MWHPSRLKFKVQRVSKSVPDWTNSIFFELGSSLTSCPCPTGVVEPVDVVDNADGTQTASYVPSREGPYSIAVRYGDDEVPHR